MWLQHCRGDDSELLNCVNPSRFQTSLIKTTFVLLEDKQKGKSQGVVTPWILAMVYRCFRYYLLCFGVFFIYRFMRVLEESDDFVAFWR